MKLRSMLLLVVVAWAVQTGCSQVSNPVSPNMGSQDATKSSQYFKPTDTVYEMMFYTGNPFSKPEEWFDADDNPDFNAIIRRSGNLASAYITRVNGGTWGKVYTFPISCTNDYNKIRIFPASKSASCTWKLLIQEEGGTWRTWVLQDSTGQTGYMDYDFSTILSQVNAGSGVFTIQIVVEGAIDEWLQVGELYVYKDVSNENLADTLWYENMYYCLKGYKPSGWFDESNSTGLNATIVRGLNHFVTEGGGLVRLPVNESVTYGKVQSPTISGDLSIFQALNFRIDALNPERIKYKIGIQEIGGQGRFVWLHSNQETPHTREAGIVNYVETSNAVNSGMTGVINFRVELWVEKTSLAYDDYFYEVYSIDLSKQAKSGAVLIQ